VNIALIGCGAQGARWAAAVARAGHSLTVCADTKPPRAHKLAEQYGARSSNRPMAAIKTKSIDTVIVASPTHLHANQIVAAARNAKHIMCETPFTRTLSEARSAMDVIRKSSVACYVAHASEVEPHLHAINRELEAGKIGPVGFIRTRRADPTPSSTQAWYHDRAKGGGLIPNCLFNDFDWIGATAGPIEKIFIQLREERAYAFGAATLTLKTGAIAQCVATWSSPTHTHPRTQIELCGSEGIIQFDSAQTPIHYSSSVKMPIATNPAAQTIEDLHLAAFERAIGGNGDSLNRVLETMKVAEAALKSATTGKAVKL